MPITNQALEYLAANITNGTTKFDAAHTYIGVGDSDLAFDLEQTDLQGTNKLRKPMDAGYPIVNGNSVTYRSTFDTTEANFEWKEYGVFNGITGGTMLCRVVEYNSTKLSNQTWLLEVTVNFVAS